MAEVFMKKTPWYIHVPFCEKICHYCDFSVLKAPARLHSQWLEGVKKEVLQKLQDFPGAKNVKTLYWGGGTPSILSIEVLKEAQDFLKEHFDLSDLEEMTLEVNPEHLNSQNIKDWQSLDFNRFSVGIQTFDEGLLKTLGRNHNREQAIKGLEALRDSGVSYSGDLMFCLPKQSTSVFLNDLKTLIEYKPTHVSFYGLTFEEGTLFGQLLEKGKLEQPEDIYQEMYEQGVEFLSNNGIERYELSNFAKPGFESVHNSAYWTHENYLGVGPGAHSFYKTKRFWNSKHFKKWIDQEGHAEDLEVIDADILKFEKVWLGLRRREGIKQDQVARPIAKGWKKKGWVNIENGTISLKKKGWLFLDEMVSEI
jgi:putative oxygen-independent coproporphyrinogen III oxidase